jgi:hypothetical protein
MSEKERRTESGTGSERSVPVNTASEKRGATENVEARNRELMQTLDDAWNSADMETFAKRHKPDVMVQWNAEHMQCLHE